MSTVQTDSDDVTRNEAAKGFIMQAACASALTGVTLKHGGPFGAAVVREGIFISCAHNTVLKDQDPTKHAEVNAIVDACRALGSHDLSDCEIYTTCEPCPMCLGAIKWSRIKKVYTGVDRETAAKFGFDDAVFYDTITETSGDYAVNSVSIGQTVPECMPSMLKMFYGRPKDKEIVMSLLNDFSVNKTYQRRIGQKSIGFHCDGQRFGEDIRLDTKVSDPSDHQDSEDEIAVPESEKYMKILEKEIRRAVREGLNKEREIFAACIVKDDKIISIAVNEVLKQRDATATAEVLAIRRACRILDTFNLEGCSIYTTVEPDLMSLGAVLWARIGTLYFGASQRASATVGHETGLLHYRELFADPDVVKEGMGMETKVAFDECTRVFESWKEVNAIIY